MCYVLKKKKEYEIRYTKVLKKNGRGNSSSKQMIANYFLIC